MTEEQYAVEYAKAMGRALTLIAWGRYKYPQFDERRAEIAKALALCPGEAGLAFRRALRVVFGEEKIVRDGRHLMNGDV